MRLSSTLIATVAIVLAGALSYLSATIAVRAIETRAAAEIENALVAEGIDWAEAEPDGLLVRLFGTAPTEATRFRALSITGTIIDASRVIDEMEVAASDPIHAPRFSMELLRNDSGVSMVGLVPESSDREQLSQAIAKAVGDSEITDLLETANFPQPDTWARAVDFGLKALKMLPRSKISIAADEVAVTAITDSGAEKRKLEQELKRATPKGLELALDISAPRPVITPFTLRFVRNAQAVRFDACSADTEAARKRILDAAYAAGLEGNATCTIGLGVPSPKWATAVEAGLKAVAELGGGMLTLADADITLLAPEGTDPALFDRVVGKTKAALPPVFSLDAVLPKPPASEDGDAATIPEFIATKSPEGQVQLRGRVPDDLVRGSTESYAHSRFGQDQVYSAMRMDPNLPDGWPLRVLTSLEALAQLNNGSVVMHPDLIELRGKTGNPDANEEITRLLVSKLGDAETFKIDVTYEEKLDPVAALPTPMECAAAVNNILAEQKIVFAPGSTTVEGPSLEVVDRIADVLEECPDVRMEIGGHTDSQGREEMNQQLSQTRANAVLEALFARRVLTGNLTAKGYGETQPIADNDTAEGREENRRIEFRLITPEPVEETETTLEAIAEETPVADEAPADADMTIDEGSGDAGPDEGSGDDIPAPEATTDTETQDAEAADAQN